MQFTKMQAAGNDYIYLDCFQQSVASPSELSVKLSNRHFGIGSDGIILIGPSDHADFSMRIFNADGSQAQMCGNGIRCAGKYVYERGLTQKRRVTVDTLAGVRTLTLSVNRENRVEAISVAMGAPGFGAEEVPFLPEQFAILEQTLRESGIAEGVCPVSMGNPHCVLFVPDALRAPVETVGAMAERHPAFPQRANIEFVEVVDDRHLNVRVWERGSGETLACGTGACASVVAAVLKKGAAESVEVTLPGGMLGVTYDKINQQVFLQGGAEFVFDGTLL